MNNNRDNNSSREPKKDWRKRTTHQPNGLPKNLRVEVPVSCYGTTMDGKTYEASSLFDVLEDLQKNDTFAKVSIPVYISAKYIHDDKAAAKYKTIIGYVKDFDPDTATMVCVIYTKSIKLYQKIQEAIVSPRVAIKNDRCSCIIGFDIVEREEIK